MPHPSSSGWLGSRVTSFLSAHLKGQDSLPLRTYVRLLSSSFTHLGSISSIIPPKGAPLHVPSKLGPYYALSYHLLLWEIILGDFSKYFCPCPKYSKIRIESWGDKISLFLKMLMGDAVDQINLGNTVVLSDPLSFPCWSCSRAYIPVACPPVNRFTWWKQAWRQFSHAQNLSHQLHCWPSQFANWIPSMPFLLHSPFQQADCRDRTRTDKV